MEREERLRLGISLGAIGLLGAAALLATIAPAPALVRVIVVVPLLGFAPGYALMSALFPAPGSLRASFRGAMAVLLSLCLVPAVATLLDRTPWGIRPLSLVASLVLFSLVTAAIGWWRAQRLSREGEDRRSGTAAGRSGSGLRGRWLGGVVFLAVVATGVYWTLLAPPTTQPFTEFYMEPEAALLLSEPGQGSPGEPAILPFTVVNRENEERVYTVAAMVDGVRQQVVGPERVEDGGQWQGALTIDREVGADQQVELRLYREGDRLPYRTLHVWVGRGAQPETGSLPAGVQPPW